jgi:hypothetical protein
MPEHATFHGRFIAAMIKPGRPRGVFAAPGFAVYRNTWLKALIDALDANYPTVAMLLGPEPFEAIASAYARGHQPETPVLALYGDRFPDFLVEVQIASDIPYLRDVAALDRLWTESLFAPDAAALDAEFIGSLAPHTLSALRPSLHPAVRIARFETPAVTIWQAHHDEDGFDELEPDWRAESVLVTRPAGAVAVHAIGDAEHDLLRLIGEGHGLAEAVDLTARDFPDADLSGSLSLIFSSGALSLDQPAEEAFRHGSNNP